MATLRRNHAPKPWYAHVEQIAWERSHSGTPRRRRSDRPPLTHDPGWDWDGTQMLFTEKTIEEEHDGGFQPREDNHALISSGQTHTTLSLLDVARYRVTKKCSKAKSDLDDFEVVRVPRVIPMPEEEPDLEESWKLWDEWERLDALDFKRTYAEVARVSDGKYSLNISDCS